MDNEERIEDLAEAQNLIVQAITLIEGATSRTPAEGLADTYLIPDLTMKIHDNHDYLGSYQCTIQRVIEIIEEGDDYEG